MEKLLEQLGEPRSVWKWFLWLSNMPRVPGELDGVREKLLEVIGAMSGCSARVDAAGNVVATRAAAAGREERPTVCLQAHMDMVCSANNDVAFDFHTQPLQLFVDESLGAQDGGVRAGAPWLKARGTTLGADNGVGLAACLAVLEDPALVLGPIECLFTADEETTMSGAEFLPSDSLRASLLLNVDSEEERAVCVGCAGGFENRFAVRAPFAALPDVAALRVGVRGGVGGHSGIDIHRGRFNAIVGLARLIDAAASDGEAFSLHSWIGGSAPNVIPRESEAVVLVAKDRCAAFAAALRAEFERVRLDYDPIERGLELVCEDAPGTDVGASFAASRQLLDVCLNMPCGDLRRNTFDLDEVETSINLAMVGLKAGVNEAWLHVFARSSNPHQAELLKRRLRALGRVAGVDVSESLNEFPGWKPEMHGHLLEATLAACTHVFGEAPRVYSVHAGLECGFIKGKYPAMECVSIGPDIRGAHSPDERCNVESVARFYRLLVDVLGRV
jgi:dipeptidase D